MEFAILKKNVRVMMRDVGNSGVFPGSGPKAAKPAKSGHELAKTAVVANTTVKDAAAKDAKSPANDEPVPLIIQSEGPMRIDWPPDRVPVAEGPPAPPAPTLVRFERNVVALHGRIDRQPNQLNCDTLRLTLIPGDRRRRASDKAKADDPAGPGPTRTRPAPTDPPASPPRSDRPSRCAARNRDPKSAATAGDPKAGPDAHRRATRTEAPGGKPATRASSATSPSRRPTPPATPSGSSSVNRVQGPLQGDDPRSAHALYARLHRLPRRQDPPIWLEKIDYEPEEPDDGADETASPLSGRRPPNPPRKVSSVTHVVTASATLYDRGHGLDLADVRAYGPGRLETRPDLKEPVERIAQWQDELIIVNVVGDDDKLRQKQVTLTGTRPFFVDLVKKTSLDSGQEIKVFLKPPSPPPAGTAPAMSAASPVAADGTARPISRPGPPGRRCLRGPERPAAKMTPRDRRRGRLADSAGISRSSGCWRIATSISWPPTAGWKPANGSMPPSSRSIPRRPRTRRRGQDG